jgi:hypothetical protein
MRLPIRLTALLSVIALCIGGLLLAAPAQAAPFVGKVDAKNCYQWDDAGYTTGYIRISTASYRDDGPSPDKVRLVYFAIENHTTNTASVQIRHYRSIGPDVINWWAPSVNGQASGSFVLPSNTNAGNFPPGHYWPGENGWDTQYNRALPARASGSARPDLAGSYNYNIYRPANGSTAVAQYSPYNEPWWDFATPAKQALSFRVVINGYASTCVLYYGRP